MSSPVGRDDGIDDPLLYVPRWAGPGRRRRVHGRPADHAHRGATDGAGDRRAQSRVAATAELGSSEAPRRLERLARLHPGYGGGRLTPGPGLVPRQRP